MTDTKEVLFRDDPDVIEQIDAATKKMGVSRTDFIRLAIRAHLLTISLLPGPADADRPLVATIQNGDK